MATRNIPWYSTYNYWPVANLIALGEVVTNSLDDGCLIYVQDIKTSFNLDKNSVLVPDGSEIIGAHDGGNWIKSSLNTPMIASFDNIAALAVEPSGAKQEGTLVYVVTVRDYFELRKSDSSTPDGISIVAAVGGGNWIRTLFHDPSWFKQTTWYVDGDSGSATYGNDENDGLVPARAIRSWAELARRIGNNPKLDITVTITLLGDTPTSDPLNMKIHASDGLLSSFIFVGVRKELFSGTITAYTQDFTADNPGTITCATPGWDPDDYLFNLCTVTSGAANGARFRIAKNLGGGAARVFPIMKGNEDYPDYATPGNVNGCTFTVWQQTRCGPVYLENANGNAVAEFSDIEVIDDGYFTFIYTMDYVTSRRLSAPTYPGQRSYMYLNNSYTPRFCGIFGTVYLLHYSEIYAGMLCESFIMGGEKKSGYINVYGGLLIQGHGYNPGGGWTEGGTVTMDCGGYFYGPIGIFDSTGINKIRGLIWMDQYDTQDRGLIYGTNTNHVAACGNVPIISLYPSQLCGNKIGGGIFYTAYVPRISNTYLTANVEFKDVGNYLWTQMPLASNSISYAVTNSFVNSFGFQGCVIVGANGTAAGTKYLLPGFIEDTDENVAAFASPYNVLIGKLYINARVAPGAGQTYTVEVNVNGSPQITLALTEANTTASSSTIIHLPAGQRVTFKAVASGGSAAADITVVLRVGI